MSRPSQELAIIHIQGKQINIKASGHAMDRMEQYEVEPFVVAGNVLALGPERIAKLQESKEEAIIIDEVKNLSVVVGFDYKTVTIITVIPKSNVFVKSNTSIVNL